MKLSRNLFLPFTYYLYHKPTKKHYYGVRYANDAHPESLWKTYFSSSKIVKKLIEEYGSDSFFVKVRKIFKTKEKAFKCEQKILTKFDVLNNVNWINSAIGGTYKLKRPHGIPAWNKGKSMSEIQKKKISEKMKGRTAWNKGIPNSLSAQNGKNGAEAMSIKAKGRKRLYKSDGSWTWIY